MRNIVLICSGGMTTSMLEVRMKAYAKEIGYECDIHAYGLRAAPTVIPSADIVLLGPQVCYFLKRFETSYPNKLIVCIERKTYGMMDGKGALEFVKAKLHDE